jgi:hypothetical protein
MEGIEQPIIYESTFLLGDNKSLTVSSSSYYVPNLEAPFRALFGPESSEFATANQWTTGTPSYTDGGHFAGSYSCCNTMVDTDSVRGEWLQVKFSCPQVFRELSIMANRLNPLRAPKAFVLAGSTDGVNWTALCHEDGLDIWAPKEKRTFSLTASLPLTHFRLIVKSTVGTEGWLTIDKMLFHK